MYRRGRFVADEDDVQRRIWSARRHDDFREGPLAGRGQPATSATSSGPLLRTLFTRSDTGWAVSSLAGAGTRTRARVTVSQLAGSSHASQAAGGRMTGIRSCSGATVSLA